MTISFCNLLLAIGFTGVLVINLVLFKPWIKPIGLTASMAMCVLVVYMAFKTEAVKVTDCPKHQHHQQSIVACH